MKNKPTILVVFGITGDLAQRYILKSIEGLADKNKLPEKFHIIGITRKKDFDIQDLFKNKQKKGYLQKNISICSMDVLNLVEYKKLTDEVDELEKKWKAEADIFFYLSIPPENTLSIISILGKVYKIEKNKNINILFEKPFGTDLKSAKDIIKNINKYFSKEKVFRTDHYLFKKIVQEIMSSKKTNVEKWNSGLIEKIEITASETIGIEGRANFYEKTGCLIDMVQSHLLELLSVTLLQLPKIKVEMPKLRYKALKNLTVLPAKTKKAQYEGYSKEVGLSKSKTETFTSVILKSTEPKFKKIRISLTTGKALDKKETSVRIVYKDKIAKESELIFKEGYDKNYSAYEEVLYNAINKKRDLFVSEQEILENWRILSPIQKSWSEDKKDLPIYKKGSSAEQVLVNLL